jgi:hypothetical protein
VLLVLKATLGLPEPQVRLAQPAPRVLQEKLELLEPQVFKALQASMARQALQASMARQARQGSKALLERLELLAKSVQLDRPVSKVLQVLKVKQVPQAL